MLKEDLHCTPADIVFGTSITLLGQYFGVDKISTPIYVYTLNQENKRQNEQIIYFPPTRIKVVKKSLFPNYPGLHKMLEQHKKYYRIQKQKRKTPNQITG